MRYKRRYLVWWRNLNCSLSRIFHLFVSTLYQRFCSASHFSISFSTFSTSSNLAFTRFLHRIMHFVHRPLSFLFSIRFSFFRLFETRFVPLVTNPAQTLAQTLFDVSSPHLVYLPIALSIFSANTFYFQIEFLFLLQHLLQRRTPHCPLRIAMTWTATTLSFNAVRFNVIISFAIPPYSDSEPAASGSFSFSRSSKMLRLR